LWDLLPAVRRHVYHPEFEGSFSLKSVLPALVPGMSYKSLEVGDGAQAGCSWAKLLAPATSAEAKARLKQALLDYCTRDTLALATLCARLAAMAPRGAKPH
jgi:hypothetical protein